MKSATLFQLSLRLLILPLLVLAFASLPLSAQTEEDSHFVASEQFSHAELSRMLAPIALYPDVVLAQILMAATYPIEVIEADRWLKRNPELEGRALDEALLRQAWAPSVKELCHLPSILALMSERIGETTELGNAFLAQEEEVMEVVQELRSKAYKRGRLATTAKHKVVVTETVIIIEPRDPRVIYVPYYDPCYVYAPWSYPPCTHTYWRPSGLRIKVGIAYWPGFYFGYSFGTWSYFDWHRHSIHIDVYKRPRFVRHDHWRSEPGRWIHSPVHRRGIAYRDLPTSRKYRQAPVRAEDVRRELRRTPDERSRDRKRFEHQRKRQKQIEARPPAPVKIERDRRERQRFEEGRREQERTRTPKRAPERLETKPKDLKRSEKGRERVKEVIDQRQMKQEREQRSREVETEREEHRPSEKLERGGRGKFEEDAPVDRRSGGKGTEGWRRYER